MVRTDVDLQKSSSLKRCVRAGIQQINSEHCFGWCFVSKSQTKSIGALFWREEYLKMKKSWNRNFQSSIFTQTLFQNCV